MAGLDRDTLRVVSVAYRRIRASRSWVRPGRQRRYLGARPPRRDAPLPSAPNRLVQGRLFKDHVTDDARQMLADRVVEHLKRSGFEIDEGDQVMRKRPPTPGHG
jgi:hypothetical protein